MNTNHLKMDDFYRRMRDAVIPAICREDSPGKEEERVERERGNRAEASRRRKNFWQPKSGAGNLGVKDRWIFCDREGGNSQYEKAQISDQNRKSKRHELVSKNRGLFRRIMASPLSR